tara:strand:+ start:870 stop:1061 length:192 start_codon:yes stop_codon:yes gene_type:complete
MVNSMINEHADTGVYDLIDTNNNKILSIGYVLTKREADQKNYALSLNGIKLKYNLTYLRKQLQ